MEACFIVPKFQILKYDKIIFTSDILRVTDGPKSRDLFARNTYWLYQIVRQPLQTATQLDIEILEWETGSAFDGSKVYDLLNLPNTVEGWVKFYYQETIPAEVVAYFEPFLKNAIVMGFEVPAYFMKICTALGLPCINIMWDPIRFMDDIFFCFNTNHPAIFEQLQPYQLAETLIYQTADLHRARVIRQTDPTDLEGVLILGQTHIDRSLIEGDRLVTLADFQTDLKALHTEGNLWFKKHPFDLAFEEHKATLERIGLQLIPEKKYNTYELFCSSRIKHVAAVSSGAVMEAKYFRKSAQTFIEPYYQHYQDFNTHADNYCVSVFSDFLNVNFWANVLKPVCDTTSTLSQQLPFKFNRMRKANSSFWGYKEPTDEQLIVKYDE